MSQVIVTKPCSKCKEVKSITHFYRQHTSKDGHHNQCKQCRNVYLVAYRKIHAQRYEQYLKIYSMGYRQTPRGKAAQSRGAKQYSKNHPDRRKAHDAVHHAVEAGCMQPAMSYMCKYCPESAEQYHHPSYAKPDWFVVEPVCRKCHIIIHNFNGL